MGIKIKEQYLNRRQQMSNNNEKNKPEIYESCPHCGHKLSPWQQVLLKVDRALTCKNCWYRILLDPPISQSDKTEKDDNYSEGKN